MSSTRDYYEVLGVTRDADDATIKKAFRRLARELHPDVNRHDPDAEEKFKEAAEAYEVLSDSDRRATYDRYGREGLRSGGYAPNFESFGSVSDIFEAFFGGAGAFGDLFGMAGGRATGAIQGGDVAVSAEIELAEAARGAKVEVSYEAVAVCEHCHGNGAEPGTPIETCPRCQGSGQLQAVSRTPFGQVMRTTACDVCGGDGKVAKRAVQGVPGPGSEGRAPEGEGGRAGGHLGRSADPDRRPRPRRRARRTSRRPVRADPRAPGLAVRPRRRRSRDRG